MYNYRLEKGLSYKLFMLLSFSIFAAIMYQGHVKDERIYTILLICSLLLCAFQFASIIYVFIVKRVLLLNINEELISWEFYDNKKLFKKNFIKINDIKDIKTEINYLTGNIYSTFQITFKLKDDDEVILTDGLMYDFGLEQAQDISRNLLKHNIGDEKDVRFSNIIKELEVDITKEQIFTHKISKNNEIVGIISKNKEEFLSLRLQIEKIYSTHEIVKKNTNSEFLLEDDSTNSYIYLRSNVLGYMVEFNNVRQKAKLKIFKDMGRKKISIF